MFPPTYAPPQGSQGARYAEEPRYIDGELAQTVLLDSVPSQANRMQQALLASLAPGSRKPRASRMERVVITEGIQCQDQGAVLYALHRHRETGHDFVDGYCAGLAKSIGAVLLTNDREIAKKTGVIARYL